MNNTSSLFGSIWYAITDRDYGVAPMDIDVEPVKENKDLVLTNLVNSVKALSVKDKSFNDVFIALYKEEPNIICNLQQRRALHAFEGTTRFNSSYEPAFYAAVRKYNSTNNKYLISYKKELSQRTGYNFYDCVYTIRLVSRA